MQVWLLLWELEICCTVRFAGCWSRHGMVIEASTKSTALHVHIGPLFMLKLLVHSHSIQLDSTNRMPSIRFSHKADVTECVVQYTHLATWAFLIQGIY